MFDSWNCFLKLSLVSHRMPNSGIQLFPVNNFWYVSPSNWNVPFVSWWTSCSLTYSTFHIICYTASIGRFFEEEHTLVFTQHDEFPSIWLGLTLGSCRAILGLTWNPQQQILQNLLQSDWTIPFQFSPLFFAKLVAWGASSLLPNSVRVAKLFNAMIAVPGESPPKFWSFYCGKRGNNIHQCSPWFFKPFELKEFTFDTNFWPTIIWHQLYMICLRVVLQHCTISDTNFLGLSRLAPSMNTLQPSSSSRSCLELNEVAGFSFHT